MKILILIWIFFFDRVLLDKNSYLENFSGNVEFKENKITNANLVSRFPNPADFKAFFTLAWLLSLEV